MKIPDQGLRDGIRAALHKPAGDITVADMESLTELDVSWAVRGPNVPPIISLEGLQTARNLRRLDLTGGLFFEVNLATSDLSPLAGLTNLTTLDISLNHLCSLTIPTGLTNLTSLYLSWNGFASLTLPAGLTSLAIVDLYCNQLTNLTISDDLSSLTYFILYRNQLRSLTVPTGLTSLALLDLSMNPLATLVLPEPIAGHVAPYVGELMRQGVAVYLYPLEVRLVAGPPAVADTFTFTLAGPPGTYRVQATSDFSTWTDLDVVPNVVGSGVFTDSSVGQGHSFYRVKLVP